jgi:hypothetical protein
MELSRFADIVAGTRTLAELERRNPKLARGLKKMVVEVVDVCDKAYGRLTKTLHQVIALEDSAGADRRAELQAELGEAGSHEWFKNVEKICARLHVLDDVFGERLLKVAAKEEVAPNERSSLDGLIHLLEKSERDIEEDVQKAAGEVGKLIAEAGATGNAAPARDKAQAIIDEIASNMRILRRGKDSLLATGTNGITDILTDPWAVLKAATRAVPAVGLALGLAGIAAAASIIRGFVGGSGQTVVVTLGFMLAGMLVLYLVAATYGVARRPVGPQARLLLWVVALFVSAVFALVLSALTFRLPEPMAELLGLSRPPQVSEEPARNPDRVASRYPDRVGGGHRETASRSNS